tara:strand:- start:57 stop:338 length:282 start_codon:yes stop_codon:yes gene_type:complete
MEPTLKINDLIIYKPNHLNNLNIGSIVLAIHPIKKDTIIVKKILKKEINGIFLIGDNKQSSQDSRHFGLINFKNIIGIVEIVISNNEFFLLNN